MLSLYYVATHKMVKFIQMVNDSKVHINTNFCMLKSRSKKIIKYWVGSNTCFWTVFCDCTHEKNVCPVL